MAVYAICTACGTRRNVCANNTAHKRFFKWRADVHFGNNGGRLRKTFLTQELALTQERQWQTDYERGVLLPDKKVCLYGELADKYWAEHAKVEARNPEKTTFYTVEKSKEWLGVSRKVSPLTDLELIEFQNDMRSLQRRLRGEGLAGATVNRNFNIIRSILQRGREWGMVVINPLEFVNRVQEDEPATRFLEETEINHLRQTVLALKDVESDRINRLLDYMTVILHTGARPSSIAACSFDNGDVDLNNRVIWFTTYKGGRKRKKHRYPHPIDDVLFPLILQRAELTKRRGPVFDCTGLRELEVMAVKESKINEGKPDSQLFTMYGLKHCYASHLLMSGASLFEVGQLLGHTDSRMVEKHYGHLTMGHLRKVQGKINLTPEFKIA